jgi:hypothetical protein
MRRTLKYIKLLLINAFINIKNVIWNNKSKKGYMVYVLPTQYYADLLHCSASLNQSDYKIYNLSPSAIKRYKEREYDPFFKSLRMRVYTNCEECADRSGYETYVAACKTVYVDLKRFRGVSLGLHTTKHEDTWKTYYRILYTENGNINTVYIPTKWVKLKKL